MIKDNFTIALEQANAIEESLVGSLTTLIKFYTERNLGVSVDEEKKKIIIDILTRLQDDTERHRFMLKKMYNKAEMEVSNDI